MKIEDNNKKRILLLFCVCFSLPAFGQWKIPQDYPGPNAASLGLYGQIPVGCFTGVPDISIPIETIQLREYQLPIDLRYHIESVKPDVQPGWTGLGWTLVAGGSITRIIHGLRDETTADDYTREKGGQWPGYDLGYYYRSSELINAANWTDATFLKPYSYSNGNSYANGIADFDPDEFLFNFCGYSGSFFYNGKVSSKDQFKIKSQQPLDLDISWVMANTNPNFREYLTVFKKAGSTQLPLQSYISKISIIDQNGIKYEFGGNTDAIDFTTASGTNCSVTTAVTWHLTSVTTPNGDYIRFTYKKDGDLFVNINLSEKLYVVSTNSGCTSSLINVASPSDTHLSVLHSAYLSQITTSAGETIDFKSSVSDELGYTFMNTVDIWGIVNADFKNRTKGNYKLKLDTIAISNSKEKLKNFYFKYTNDLSSRLHLDSLKTDQYKYVFVYNSTKLPVYNAKYNDNWGFYNGKSFNGSAFSTLAQFRTPDINYMKAETLEEIIYPTGGSAKFDYEAHTYSKVATLYSDPQNIFALKNESGTAGGLRIRKITSRPDRTSSVGEVVKEYFYTLPDNSSSGILSGKPVYETIMTLIANGTTNTGYYQSENFINPLGNTNGAHVTYSRVVEKMSDGSSSVYYYTNSDEQKDEPAVYGILTYSFSSGFIAPFSSKEIGRGLLKAEVKKNSQNVTVDSINYVYNYPYDPFIKSICRINYPMGCYIFESMFCYKQYACVPVLSNKTEIRYDVSGNNPVSVTTNYSYNSKNLLSSSYFTRSDGKTQTTKFIYPFEVTQGADLTAMQNMTGKHILSDYVEKVVYLGSSQVIDGEYRKYSETKANSGIYKPERIDWLPKTAITLNSQSSYYQPEKYFTYDNWGNIKESKPISGNITTTYLWGYNYQYPIAEIKGAAYSEVTAKISETSLNTIATKSELTATDSTTINNLRTQLPKALVTTYTYKPLVGIQSMTDPRGVVTKYDYDSFGRLSKVTKADKVIESYDYHYKN